MKITTVLGNFFLNRKVFQIFYVITQTRVIAKKLEIHLLVRGRVKIFFGYTSCVINLGHPLGDF
jgi:hypothetical protein